MIMGRRYDRVCCNRRPDSPAELMQAYGFTGEHIAEMARKAIARKK